MVSLGDKIELLDDTYKVIHHKDGYFLENTKGNSYNDVIFEKLRLDKIKFTGQVLEYYDNGIFPFCKTLEDLNKLITALRAKINPCISTEIW